MLFFTELIRGNRWSVHSLLWIAGVCLPTRGSSGHPIFHVVMKAFHKGIQDFSGGDSWYLGIVESMGHAPKMLNLRTGTWLTTVITKIQVMPLSRNYLFRAIAIIFKIFFNFFYAFFSPKAPNPAPPPPPKSRAFAIILKIWFNFFLCFLLQNHPIQLPPPPLALNLPLIFICYFSSTETPKQESGN